RRRLSAVCDPRIEGVEQSTQERPVITGIREIIADAEFRRRRCRPMLGTPKGVDANVLRYLRIGGSERIGMDKGTGAVPVFGSTLGVDHFGKQLRITRCQLILALAERVNGRSVGEREHISREKMLFVLIAVARRLSEAMVE